MAASIDRVLETYLECRYLDAYEQSKSYWRPETDLDELPIEALVLGGRLARFLGGPKISAHLFRVAAKRSPELPIVKLYCEDARRPLSLLEELRRLEVQPELASGDDRLDASWVLQSALVHAGVRDFSRANKALERAADFEADTSWAQTVEAHVRLLEDRWEEAYDVARRGWERCPGHPATAKIVLMAGVRLQKLEDCVTFARELGASEQSVDLVLIAISHFAMRADRAADEAAARTWLDEIERFDQRLDALAPLADRHHDRLVAAVRADVAQLAGDRSVLVEQAKRYGSRYFRTVAKNIEDNPDAPRVIAKHEPTFQKHDTCLPASFVTVAHAFGHELDHEVVWRAIMYGGTPMWRLADYCRPLGLALEHFVIDAAGATALLEANIPFLVTLREVDSSHAVAAVGVDLAERTLIVHDPSHSRPIRFLLDHFEELEAPFGPMGTVVIPEAERGRLDDMPLSRREIARALERFDSTIQTGTTADRDEIAKAALEAHPDDPIAKWMVARAESQRGARGTALQTYEALVAEHPEALVPQVGLLDVTGALGNTARMSDLLASMVRQEKVPGASGSQEWIRPRPMHLARYADVLRASTDQHADAVRYLHRAMRFDPSYAPAYHVLADLLYQRGDRHEAELPYRAAALLAPTNEHYAWAYADLLAADGRRDDALAWLEMRTAELGDLAEGGLPWLTLSDACKKYGLPERSSAALESALRARPDDPELAVGAAERLVHAGQIDRARSLIEGASADARAPTRLQAAFVLLDYTADRSEVLELAEAWVNEAPRDYEARSAYLAALAEVETADAAEACARRWIEEHPDDEMFEDLLLDRLDMTDDRYVAMVRARTTRNPYDGNAWRCLAHALLSCASMLSKARLSAALPEIEEVLEACRRTSPNAVDTITAEARSRELAGDWDGVLSAYERALRQEPAASVVYRAVAANTGARSKDQNKRVAAMLTDAVMRSAPPRTEARTAALAIAANVGLMRGLEAVRTWRAAFPNDPDLIEAEIDVLVSFGGTHEALEEAHRLAVEACERFRHMGLYLSRSEVERRLNRPEAMIETLEGVLTFAPGAWSARDGLVDAMAKLGRTEEALTVGKEGIRLAPSSPTAWRSYAMQLWSSDRHDEALGVLAEAIEKMPSYMGLRELRIQWLSSLDRGDEAIADARAAVERFPDGAYTYLMLARALGEHGGTAAKEETEAAFRRAIELNDDLFDAVDELAVYLVFQNDHAAAMKLLDDRIESGRDRRAAVGRRIWVKRMRGVLDEAREEMALLVRTHPDYWWAWDVLMDWLERDEAWDEARAILPELPPRLDALVLRVRALSLLRAAGVPDEELESDWGQLVDDFPQEPSVLGPRIDALLRAGRAEDAKAVLGALEAAHPTDATTIVHKAQLMRMEGRPGAIDVGIELGFDEDAPPSAIKRMLAALAAGGVDAELARAVTTRIDAGRRPRKDFFTDLAYLLETRSRVDDLRSIARSLEKHDWCDDELLASALLSLAEAGSAVEVLEWFDRNPERTQDKTQLWQAKGRTLLLEVRFDDAATWLADWEKRPDVELWAVTNYVAACRAGDCGPARQLVLAKNALSKLVLDHGAGMLAWYTCEARLELEQTDTFCEHYPSMRRLMIMADNSAAYVPALDAVFGLFSASDAEEAKAAWRVFKDVLDDEPPPEIAALMPLIKPHYARWLTGLKRWWFDLVT